MTDTDRLTGLIKEHYGTKYQKVLQCAQDIWDALKETSAPAEPRRPWEPDLTFLTGINITVIPSYAPGRWKLVRHDHCEVIGGETIDQAMIVTHEDCTILAESWGST